MHSKEEKLKAFEHLLDIMDELRAKCPWDKEQTFESIRNLTTEETYELTDAIIDKDTKEIRKELGDLLLHIVFYSKIASETNLFDIKDVADGICEKLIFRHPHVFGDVNVNGDSEKVKQNWEDLKKKEGNKRVLQGVPRSLPALIKASRIQEKARSAGFDWEEREHVWDKVKEEMEELLVELKHNQQENMEKEFGDLFFSLVNAARLYNIDPENALEKTNKKFIRRFNFMEDKANEINKHLKDMTLAEMDKFWEEAKKYDL